MKQIKASKDFLKGSLVGGVVATCIVAGVLFATGVFNTGTTVEMDDVSEKLQVLQETIDEKYLYSDDLVDEDMQNGILKGYVAGLGDPYSAYYSPEEYKSLLEATSGHFYGIGVMFFEDEKSDEITVKTVYKDAPAYKAGIKEGDILKKVDGESISDKKLEEIVKTIKGDKGTKVKLTVERNGKEQEVTIERDEVVIDTVEGKIVDGNIGYIQILEFTSDTSTQFDDTLKDLESKNTKGLIIDLRNNPGGLVDTTCKILDKILPEGKIVYTKDKNGKVLEITSNEEDRYQKPIVVLINGNSASASEIFAGAIQDYGLGAIIGEKSYGKGVVQQLFPLEGGAGIKLTVSEYFTPKGQRINGEGVTPDIEVTDDRIENPNAEDSQLKRAIKEIRNKI